VSVLPDDEVARLKELWAYDLIDTPPEAEFNDLVRLASIVCDTPVALVSLVDASRQWFKAKQGIDISETPRSVAFCNHIILQKDLMVIEDAAEDPRFSCNPLVVSDPKIRFYAGAPLITAAGHALGSLCVIDFIPRTLDQNQREALQLLSRQVVSQIERRRAQAELVVAEQVKQAMDQLLSLLSHELRTPLNAILGWAQVLSKGVLSESQVRQASGAIERSARTQGNIIDDLLTLNRMLAKDVSIARESVQVVEVIESVVKSLESSANDKKIRFVRHGFDFSDAFVLGDRHGLRQVFSNIISNALRFSRAESDVGISIQRSGSAIQVVVSDHGVGISPDFMPHLFDRFRQADSSPARRHGGMGVGLAIAKYLVDLHHGEISVSSAGEGRGAQVTVTLPLLMDRHVVDESSASSDDVEALRGKRVLVVDDEPDSLALVLELLRERGAHAVGATSAADGMKVAAQLSPELIVSDIGMPITDGYDFIRELRKQSNSSLRQVPALALTAFAGEKERLRALAAGFDRHMPKPFDGGELLRSLGQMVQQS
jgi:signal transduction histidine kinase/ActR/RegA family two-component response regulator